MAILGLVLVVAIAAATVFILSQVSEPEEAPKTTEQTLADSLSDAYRAGGGNGNFFGEPVVQSSATDGYKNAHVKIDDGSEPNERPTAFFYQAPDGSWQFLTTAKNQDSLSCDLYNTEVLVNAYLGFTCKDGSKSSFVERENPKFEVLPGSSGG